MYRYCAAFRQSRLDFLRMTVMKRYVLKLFISLKYITANVVDRNNGRIIATASTVEHALKSTMECGRTCNAKAAAVVGEVLAMRLKVEGLEEGQGRGIHVDVNKEKTMTIFLAQVTETLALNSAIAGEHRKSYIVKPSLLKQQHTLLWSSQLLQ
ncbi:hypothetical protein Ancab_012898 [Ancistrocladus abbreviatus]